MIIRRWSVRLFSTKRLKRAVFLGSPDVAADTLKTLHAKAKLYSFNLIAVVTQPSCTINGPTAVEKLCHKLGVTDMLLTPKSPADEEFLARMKDLKPDICLTAAYGGFLPRAFLEIPPLGVYNIHPSLLPQYRGAAPVQRCLEEGKTETGVTVLKTVLKMDAGPVLGMHKVTLNGTETANVLTKELFEVGTQMFLQSCADIFRDSVVLKPQDEEGVTLAKKITPEESMVDFTSQTATQIFNKYRGFADKPGIKAVFYHYGQQQSGKGKGKSQGAGTGKNKKINSGSTGADSSVSSERESDSESESDRGMGNDQQSVYSPFEVKLNSIGLLLPNSSNVDFNTTISTGTSTSTSTSGINTNINTNTNTKSMSVSSSNSSDSNNSDSLNGLSKPHTAVKYVVPNPRDPHPCLPEPLTTPYFEVVCGDGSRLALLTIQPSTRREMTAKEFHNGNRKQPFYL